MKHFLVEPNLSISGVENEIQFPICIPRDQPYLKQGVNKLFYLVISHPCRRAIACRSSSGTRDKTVRTSGGVSIVPDLNQIHSNNMTASLSA